MKPTGHIYPPLQGRASVYCVRFLHSLHRGAAASTCPLLSPVCLYVVCASLRVPHWHCQRVLCWSLVWFQGCWPQSQFGAEGGYWHHKAYMGPQDQETVSGSLGQTVSKGTNQTPVLGPLISLHSSGLDFTAQLWLHLAVQNRSQYTIFLKEKTLGILNYFTVKETLFRFNRHSTFTAHNMKPPISTNWTVCTAKQHNKLWSGQGLSQYTVWYK